MQLEICKNCQSKEINSYGECKYFEPIQQMESCRNFEIVDKDYYENKIRQLSCEVKELEQQLKNMDTISKEEYSVLLEIKELVSEMDSQPAAYLSIFRYLMNLNLDKEE